jgi:tRNA dimethylallyltransferase
LRRSIRALEVIFHSGRKFSEQKRKSGSPYRTLQLGLNLPRPVLYARIDARIEEMVAAGLVAEVKDLLDSGYATDLPPLTAIGYRQIVAYLQGEISLEDGIQQIRRDTRKFVRRQANWFKTTDPQIHWFQAGEETVEAMSKEIQKFLES